MGDGGRDPALSWKLSTSQTKQLEREQDEKLQSSVHFHIFNKENNLFNLND